MPIALPYRKTSPRRIGFVVAAAALTLPIASACSPDEPEATDPGTTPPVWEDSPSPSPGEEGQGGEGQGDEGAGGQTLTADLQSPDGTTVATAEFDFSDGYATITVETVAPGQLTPGFHGLHVHSVGTCEPDSMPPGGGEPGDFKSASGHFQAPGHTDWPASGDLSNLQVRQDGSAMMVTTSDMFTAEQLLAGEGTSLMIHERASNFGNIPPEKYQQVNGTPGPDEETLKTGDAGGRVACGAIGTG